MAFFGVTLEKIKTISDHPNADRLSVAQVEGLAFQFVTAKNQFAVGDMVLYIPVDSLLPLAVSEKMGLAGKLSGKNKDRVKSIKLRGLISQGVVTSPEKLLPENLRNSSSEEMTTYLGITKYEPPLNMVQDGILTDLPEGYSKYDIEGADRFTQVAEILMDQQVVVMEKMEGTNFSAGYLSDGTVCVNQRNNQIVEKEGAKNSYWEAARDSKLLEQLHSLGVAGAYAELCGPGIQKNIYALKKHVLYLFDVKRNGRFVNYAEFKDLLKNELSGLVVAPVLFEGTLRDFLQGRTIQEASNGPSVINPAVLREGIVIKPVFEQHHPQIGRLILKQRSPEYLAHEE